MRKIITFFLLISFCILSCNTKKESGFDSSDISEEVNTPDIEIEEALTDHKDTLSFSVGSYNFIIEQVDPLEFQELYHYNYKERPKIVKVTSLATVQKILKGYITIDTTNQKTIDIAEIRDRKGNIISSVDEYKGKFKAYYPMEDIILLNGGHDSDMTFNLTTGESTELIGSPEISVSSPNKRYEITGWYGGQECTSYIIRRYTDGQFTKIADLASKELCYFVDTFWLNDTTFYYSINTPISPKKEETKEYYKLLIKEI